MLGAIIGDVVGSRFEFCSIKSKKFAFLSDFFGCRFTDDTVMTIAIGKALLDCKGDYSHLSEVAIENMRNFGKRYPNVSYGGGFWGWIHAKIPLPYNSYGNGSAMRISAVPYFANSIGDVKILSEKVTKVTHNHPEGMKGAEAIAVCIWLALHGATKNEIKSFTENHYYKLDFDYKNLVENYRFDETCQGSVPQAIYCFLISESFEDAVRTAISIGGDADTLGAITGSIAEAFYGIPDEIEKRVFDFLPQEFINIIREFVCVINRK